MNRLLDVLPVLHRDHRVQVVFTVDPGSRFADGAAERIRGAGFRLIPWDEAVDGKFDLALSASDKGELARIAAPLVLMQHGVGYHRRAPGSGAVSGLAPSAFVDGTGQPTTVVLAHPGQRARLAEVSAAAAERAVVVGDPCLDRMLAGARTRGRYRSAFGVEGRRLVVISSTWGPVSLLGRDVSLPGRVLAELSVDEYRVAAVLHPNVWARHGEWAIRGWLADALEAGLMLIGPDEGWRAAVIAADALIADHSSVTCYAAALGKPVLFAADGGDEVVPGSPMDTLRATLPRLTGAEPVGAQLERVLAAHEPQRTIALTDPIFAHHGEAAQRLRSLLYRLLGLPRPATPVTAEPVPVPDIERHRPAALIVRSTVARRSGRRAVVTLHRTPASVHEPGTDADQRPFHLVADADRADLRSVQAAAVLVRHDPSPLDAARTWAERVLAEFPGARIAAAAAGGDVLLRIRPATELLVRPNGTEPDPAAWGPGVDACLLSGLSLSEITQLELSTGSTHMTGKLIELDR